MSLKRRAVSGVIIASSLVMMCAAADATDTVMGEEVIQAAATEMELATNGTAGVVVLLNEVQADALSSMEQAAISIERTKTDVVASAEEATDEEQAVLEAALSEAEFEGKEADRQKNIETDASLTDVVEAAEAEEAEIEETEAVAEEAEAEAETAEVAAAETVEENTAEEAAAEEWQNRLMADVDEFLYVRAGGDENAEIIGKLYNGAVAEIVEVGDTWTHIVSGKVEGYVKNDYCVTGEAAFEYAVENVETQAEIQTDGLRVRSEADENGKVLTAVSTGTTLTVDTETETNDEWVAVKYGDGTAYVSAEYVTTDLALGEAVSIEEERAALAKKAEEEAKAAQVSGTETVQKASVAASVDEVTLLAALIQCEAGNESYEGQLAVGAVVMNRVRSGRYPGSVSGVIYDRGQFTPAASGAVASVAANGPKASCVQAAQEALAGADNTGGATCFRRASSGMAGVVIGNHVFF